MFYFLRFFPKKRDRIIYRSLFGRKKQSDPKREENKEKIEDGGGGGEGTGSNVSYGAIYQELFARCPQNQQKHLKKLYEKHLEYVSRLKSHNNIPQIDWKKYKAEISDNVQLVEEFEKQYKSFKVPKPEIPKEISILLDEEALETKERLLEFIEASNMRICELEVQIQYIQSMLPYDQMTMEDYIDARPEVAPDFINNPTFWPHTPEENTPPNSNTLHDFPVQSDLNKKESNEKKVETTKNIEKSAEKKESTEKENEIKPDDKK